MRSSRCFVVVPFIMLLAAFAPGARASEEPTIHVAGGARPPVLELLDAPQEDLLAVAISAEGDRAAVAVERSVKPERSTLLLYELGREAPVALEVPGRLRDLLFSRDGATVYALQHKSAKKREGDTYLIGVDWATAKTRKGMRVPSSSSGLDHWVAREAVLIAARNEIRTLLTPALRSGPLFRVPGENTSVASLGGNLVLVGQEDGLILVDLGAPSGREAMPVSDRTSAPAAVVSLAAEPDGLGALARLADGRLVAVGLAPLSLGEPQAPALDVTGAPVTSEPPPAPEPPPVAAEEPEPVAVEPGPAPPPAAEADHQVQGRIEGPDAGRVEEVVLFGPDDILREAARVRPGSDGRWHVDGLDPGRYRVQLDGGGSSVLVTEPRFLLLIVAPGQRVQAPALKVLREL